MEKKTIQKSGIVVLILAVISLLVLGCPQQAPPPVQTPPPAGSVQTPPPAGSVQTPAPAGSAQMPAPAASVQTPVSSGSAQMPRPAMTGTGTAPSQDIGQVLVGMTPEQVQQIMGPPAQLYQQGFIEWKYPSTPQGKVDIRFQNNKVILIEKYTKQ